MNGILEAPATTVSGQSPSRRTKRPGPGFPVVQSPRHRWFADLMTSASGQAPLAVAVVHPCDDLKLRGVDEAASLGLIMPILVGPKAEIRAAADSRPLFITEVKVNIAPNLVQRPDIVQNAIDLAHLVGVKEPRGAVG